MTGRRWAAPLAVWAARDLIRHPGRALLLFAALSSVVTLMGLVLLLDQTLSGTVRRLMAQGPAIVMRRIDAGGWAPMPVEESLANIRSVAGALRPRVRVWGVVRGPAGPVTVIGMTDTAGLDGIVPEQPPQTGQAWVGTGVLPSAETTRLSLWGRRQLDAQIIGRFPGNSSMATHDVVALHPDDARLLLGLEQGQASDLALDVYHADEARALAPDLAAAFDWPVHITTRQEQVERCLSDISRRTGMILIAFGPVLLAMTLLVAALGADSRHRRWETGLLKALGWSGAELLKLQVYRGLLVGVPAMVAGVGGAYGLLFCPGMSWLPRWLFDWNGPAVRLYLNVQGAAGGLALSALFAGVPFLAAVFWTGWQAAAADPADCIEGGA